MVNSNGTVQSAYNDTLTIENLNSLIASRFNDTFTNYIDPFVSSEDNDPDTVTSIINTSIFYTHIKHTK